MNPEGVTRRRVLQTVGAGTAGLALTGEAAAANGEHIVGVANAAGHRAAERRADSVRERIDFGDIGTAVVGRFSAQALEALENNPNVKYTERNGTMEKLAETLPWGVDRVDADIVQSDGATGAGATVAVLDTGLDGDHPDQGGNVVGGKAFETECGAESGGCRFGGEGYNGNACNNTWSDDDDHGTHVAGTADAVDNTEGVVGVATEADLLAGKVLTGCGSGSYSAIASGIKWATDQGADVINMSLGGSSGSSTLKDACQYAYDNNVVSVAAAGNDGPCSDCVGYPAAYSTVVAVSATTPSDTLAGYSSTGPEVEIAAPGGANDGNDSTSVLSTIPPESDTDGEGYAYFVGTSMATPHVAGAAALVKAETGLSDNQQIIDRLKSTAEDIGLASNEGGAGLLDAEAALGSVDSAPGVSWVTPADGDTVSGTVTVQISASDSEDSDDSLDVTYTVDGGSSRSTTYNSTSGYYEDSWDTTTVGDGDHTLQASATDSAGNTSTSSITVTTDNTESAPAVDSLSASEVETSDSDAEFDAAWDVSDADGDLSSVDLTLVQDSDGTTEDTASISVSGSSASGTTRLVAAGDEGSGNSYTVEATVTDSAGNTGTGSSSVSETENTNAAPSASIDALSDKSNPRWDRYDVDWSASDADGNLDTVVVEMLDSSGATLDSATNSVSGSSASGVDEVRSKSNGTDIRVTATDTDGASGSDSQPI